MELTVPTVPTVPTVIIPALNEPYLSTLLKQIPYRTNVRTDKGLSQAVYNGIQQAKGNIIVVMDGDGSHNPKHIKEMILTLNREVWLVVGSRYCKYGYSNDSLLRQLVSRFYCLVAQILLWTKIKDCMSGFWCGYKFAFDFEPSRTYKFGVQLIRKHKKHIREYPIRFRKRVGGKSHVKPVQAIKDFWSILKSRKNN